jgi:phosphate-selective porin OprO and OprP
MQSSQDLGQYSGQYPGQYPGQGLLRASLIALIALGFALVATAATAAESTDNGGWETTWKNGLSWKSADGQFSARFGGRILMDFAAIGENDALKASLGGNGTGVEFRSARLNTRGTAYGRLAWKADYDFASDKVKDVWITLKKVPVVGNVKFGYFKEPFSLEEITSLRFTTFMERSLAITFSPSRNTGIQINDQAFGQSATWAVGFFREMGDEFGSTKGFSDASAYQITGRFTGVPIYAEGGSRVLHLGVSYSHKYRDIGGGSDIKWKARPESHLAPVVANSGALDTDGADLLNLELAVVGGPLSLQAEYTSAWTDMGAAGTLRSWGAYFQASYFLTGEHRNYNRKKGAFARNQILKPLGEGWGAWQIAARFSRLRLLNDLGVGAGNIRDITLGLNWYLFSNFRMMANYIYSDVENTAAGFNGNANIFQMRAQVDF